MSVRPWSNHIWFSPCYIINELSRAAASKKNLKRYKEAWICAVTVICHAEIRPAEWWIQAPKEDPPDVLAMNLVPAKTGKGLDISQIQVEVFEISQFDSEAIEKSIERKLGKKDYSGMMLIGFVRRKVLFDHEAVSEYIKKLNPRIQVLAIIVSEESSTNYSYIQLFPECVKFKADFGVFCKTTSQKDFIEFSRRSTEIENTDNTTNETLTLIPN